MALQINAYARHASVVKYTGSETIVQIPKLYQGKPVTEILEDAFSGSQAEAVVLPDTLREIGDRAFFNCRKLRYIGCGQLGNGSDRETPDSPMIPSVSVMPSRLGMVGSAAFKGSALKEVVFRADYVLLAKSAFESCASLKLISFPNCTGLTFGKRVFMNSSLEILSAPKAISVTVPEHAFSGCVKLAVIDMKIDAVGTKSFYNCRNLQKLNIPNKLRHIGHEAFEGCSRLQLPDQAAEKYTPLFTPEPEDDVFDCFTDLFLDLKDSSEADTDGFEDEDENMEKLVQGNPLLVTDTASGMPSRLKGTWEKVSNAYVFMIDEPLAFYRTRLTVLETEDSIRIRPLLDYFIKHDLQILLSGRQDEHHFSIYNMTPSKGKKDVPAEVFQVAVDRFRKAVPGNEKRFTERPSFLITGDTACEAFIEMCGSLIPQWVHNAFRRNHSMLKLGSNVGMEAKRHARTSIEILVNIDWNLRHMDLPTLEEAKIELDNYFSGRDEQKNMMLEILAQSRLTGKFPKYGILFVGPPGTGKTSAAKKFAHLISDNVILVDVSTIGTNSEEVTGSSRIYSNSQAGFFLDGMFRNRSSSGVLIINELDKARETASGYSVVNTLLSVLDKNGYYDNSLEELIPTDNMFAIATANDLSHISQPILDRFYVIKLSGYSTEEKKVIFSRYALPRTMDDLGIPKDRIRVDDAAVDLLISEYSIEPGAREIERFAERIVRDYCLHADGNIQAKKEYRADDIPGLFGRGKRIVRHFAIHPGQVNMAVCDHGEVGFVLLEAAIFPGNGKFKVVGPLDRQQKEYCEVAYWSVRNTISPNVCDFSSCDVVIFVPQHLSGQANHVGAATYAAICSRILKKNYALDKACFIGGCDLNGSLFWDNNDLSAVLNAMKENGMTTLYAPLGTGELMNSQISCDCGVAVLEAINAEMLVRLAMNVVNG